MCRAACCGCRLRVRVTGLIAEYGRRCDTGIELRVEHDFTVACRGAIGGESRNDRPRDPLRDLVNVDSGGCYITSKSSSGRAWCVGR